MKLKEAITLAALALIFQGCQQPQHNTVSYKYATCKSKNNVGIKFHDGIYKCFYKKGKVIVYEKKKHDFKNPSWLNVKPIEKCETTITNVYKDGAVRCRGKILEVGQKTRIVKK